MAAEQTFDLPKPDLCKPMLRSNPRSTRARSVPPARRSRSHAPAKLTPSWPVTA